MQTYKRTSVFYQTKNMKERPQDVVSKNYSSRSFLSSGNIISCSYIAFSVIFKFLSVKSYAPILIKSAFMKGKKSIFKRVSQLLPTMDSVLLEYCTNFMREIDSFPDRTKIRPFIRLAR